MWCHFGNYMKLHPLINSFCGQPGGKLYMVYSATLLKSKLSCIYCQTYKRRQWKQPINASGRLNNQSVWTKNIANMTVYTFACNAEQSNVNHQFGKLVWSEYAWSNEFTDKGKEIHRIPFIYMHCFATCFYVWDFEACVKHRTSV